MVAVVYVDKLTTQWVWTGSLVGHWVNISLNQSQVLTQQLTSTPYLLDQYNALQIYLRYQKLLEICNYVWQVIP